MTIEPGMPGAVVRTSPELFYKRGIGWYHPNIITVPPEIFEQYRAGWRCLACHHAPQPEAFPEHCMESYCRFEMRRDQLSYLEFEYRGEETLWPDRSDDLAYQEEQYEREAFVRSTGIIVPRVPDT